jgi:hypothetical protein
MRSQSRLYLIFLLLTVLSVQYGCSSTRFTKVWSDEDIGGKTYHHILVLGVADKKGNRMDFEDYFVEQIEAEGVQATASYKLLPRTNEITRESVLEAVRNTDIDTILVTHMASIEEEEYYIPSREIGVVYGYGVPYYDSFYSYYPYVSHYVTLPSYYNTHDVVTLETSIFDIKTEKRIWSARSKSFAPDSVDQIISELAALVIQDLKARRLAQ